MADYQVHFSAVVEDLSPQEVEFVKTKINQYAETDEDGRTSGFGWDINTFQDNRPAALWIHSDGDRCNQAAAAQFVHVLFKEHRPNACFMFPYARTCDKPRTDGFGGGVMIATANKTWCINTQDMLDTMRAQVPTGAEPAKKKRGRPPKQKPVPVSLYPVFSDGSTPAPKRRGRPPKNANAASTATPANTPKPLKRRGRPPKNAAAATASPPKRRGRPPKNASAAGTQDTPKRRPGRPRKITTN